VNLKTSNLSSSLWSKYVEETSQLTSYKQCELSEISAKPTHRELGNVVEI
jgi:hypothetical protein